LTYSSKMLKKSQELVKPPFIIDIVNIFRTRGGAMSQELETLLVNVLFILFPLFVYQMFCLDKNRVKSGWNRPVFTVLSGLSIVLCMSFPIEFFPGFMFDLRQIPFIIGALYGGYRVGGWLFLAVVGYRLAIGGNGVYVNFIAVSLIAILVPMISPMYENLKLGKKILMAVAIAEISALATIFLSHLFSDYPVQYNAVSFNYFIIQGLAMWIVVYLMETMLNNYRMRMELIKAEKMNVVSQLAASISHEVKNPITITQGFIEALEDEDSIEKRKEYVGYALEELDRAKTIINEFLTLAKPESESTEIINISHEIGYVANLMHPYAKKHNVTVNLEGLEEDCYIVGDKPKIRQCFINIIKNSIEAMEHGGVLRLQTANKTNKIYIDITDTGIGMTEDEIQRLGTPYYSTKEQGTGLGMMIVFHAIKHMNGNITIESKKGKGTRFLITFPYAA
jgi:two-component system, sporulation sensor kinase B